MGSQETNVKLRVLAEQLLADVRALEYGEWLRLAEEAFAMSPSQPGGGSSPGFHGFTANWMTRYGA